jgi:hypothetical protein
MAGTFGKLDVDLPEVVAYIYIHDSTFLVGRLLRYCAKCIRKKDIQRVISSI